ncbi:MAG: putative addiction module antidote protein [Nitrospinae bacterium]|nr:putative addiction module antidote protein [Nitrospinota bacterium]
MTKYRTHESFLKERLQDPAFAAAYLEECVENGDQSDFLDALRLIAQARPGGLARVAEEAGVKRESLQRSLSPKGNPTLKTVLTVFNAAGLQLTAKAIPHRAASAKKRRIAPKGNKGATGKS